MRWCVLIAALSVACVQSKTTQCEFGICGPGTACDEVHQACVLPDQLVSCQQHPDLDPCTIANDTPGVCEDEVCVVPVCGDGFVYGEEVCDGADSIPTVGACVDYAYDFGALGCTALCGASPDRCRTFGWTFRSGPGNGAVYSIAEDAGKLYVAVQGGIYELDDESWSHIYGPEQGSGGFVGVWAVSGHVFAAGVDGDFSSGTGVLLHYDGMTWSRTEVPNAVRGVWGRSPDDVFAVGDAGTIYHFTAGAWAPMSSGTTSGLTAVYGSDTRVVAVGVSGTFLVSNGAGWSPVAGGSSSWFADVWASGPNDFYAARDDGSEVYHYDGTTLAVAATFEDSVLSISGRGPREIYAVGRHGLIYFFDGTDWTRMPSGTSEVLLAVHAGADKIYAASASAYFLEYSGAAWIAPPVGAPITPLNAVWGPSADHLFAVGTGVIEEYALNTWTELPWGGCSTKTLRSGWGTADTTELFAVGNEATIVQRSAGTWTCPTAPFSTDVWLRAVWGASSSDVFAAGGDFKTNTPGLAHYNGATWEDWSSRVSGLGTLHAVWGSGPNDVFVGGDASGAGSALYHYDGSGFAPMLLPGAIHTIDALWGSSSTDVFATGDGGAILHYDGTAWTQMPVAASATVPTTISLVTIHGDGPDNVYAAGGRTLLHYDGVRWSPVRRDGVAPTNGLFVGDRQVTIVTEEGVDPRLVGELRY